MEKCWKGKRPEGNVRILAAQARLRFSPIAVKIDRRKIQRIYRPVVFDCRRQVHITHVKQYSGRQQMQRHLIAAFCTHYLQQAQLPQRKRATLHYLEMP